MALRPSSTSTPFALSLFYHHHRRRVRHFQPRSSSASFLPSPQLRLSIIPTARHHHHQHQHHYHHHHHPCTAKPRPAFCRDTAKHFVGNLVSRLSISPSHLSYTIIFHHHPLSLIPKSFFSFLFLLIICLLLCPFKFWGCFGVVKLSFVESQ